MFGGVQAVTWTDVKQMVLIVFGLVAVDRRPGARAAGRTWASQALGIAGATGRLQTFDFSFDLTNQYTFWSGTIAALFLFCSYFGTDQSQVQRYLTARSVDEARESLLMSAYWKIPLQALVLLVGVFMFVFYLFTPPPMLFNRVHERRAARGTASGRLRSAGEGGSTAAAQARRDARHGVAAASTQRRRDCRRRGGAGVREREAEVRAIRAEAHDVRAARQPATVVQRRELRLSDVHHDPHARRAHRLAHRRDFRGRHVHHRR